MRPKNESPLGVSGTVTESLFPVLGVQPASEDTLILSTTVQASCRQSADKKTAIGGYRLGY